MTEGDDKSTVVRQVRIARGRNPDEVACIEVVTGSRSGDVIPLTTGPNLIGRGSAADVTLDDDGVSRQHAKLSVSDEGVVTMLDLDSTNGTFVNGAPVDMAIVREGDRLQIGPDVQLRFLYRAKQSLAAPDAKAVAASVGLSPRELEVAKLVAEGLTSQEIADKLHISPRTVSKHLGNIYDRLELPGRAALARYVVQHGLL